MLKRGTSEQAPDMCETCGIQPKFKSSGYCSRICQVEGEEKNTSLATTASNPPAAAPSQPNTKASSKSPAAASSIPTPAAAGHSDSVSIRPENLRDPVAKTIFLNMKNRWVSDNIQLGEMKAIYRLNLSSKIYRRFDTALQMNDGCTVITSYYGGRETCGISNDSAAVKANPCILESCAMCTVIRSAFGNFLYGNSSHDGAYGPGLYTYANPALAHRATAPTSRTQAKKYAIIQCRVVSKGNDRSSENSYAGFVDESGVVFCAQPVAIIPTHLIVYSAKGKKQDSKNEPKASSSQVQATTIRVGLDLEHTDNAPDAESEDEMPRTSNSKLSNLLGNLNLMQDEDGDDSDPLEPYHSLARARVEPDEDENDDDEDDDSLEEFRPTLVLQPGMQIYFYDESRGFYELSNYAPYPVSYKGKEYPTAEHLFQARKFLGHRPLLAEHIRRGSDRPTFAFNEGRRLAPETRPDWKNKSIRIMGEVLELKFTQHSKLRSMLLETGDKYLISDAGKDDAFWGNGADGKGQNELGIALMRLRNKIGEGQPS